MPVNPVPCPFCNALVAPPEHAAAGQRIPCPRCGEAFPYRPAESDGGPAATAITADRPGPPVDSAPPPRGWSNASVAGVVLGVMAAMAAVGLLAALATESIRRDHDKKRPPRREASTRLLKPLAMIEGVVLAGGLLFVLYRLQRRRAEPPAQADPRKELWRLIFAILGLMVFVALTLFGLSWLIPPPRDGTTPIVEIEPPFRPVPPSELAALGYLPPGTNLLAGVRVAEAVRTPAGREFLQHYRLANFDFGPARLEQWTGLRLDDIDHVVVGLQVGEQLPPPLLVVARTRRPYDAAQLRDRLKADRRTERHGKTLYRFKLDKPPLDPVLWCPDERTVVAGLKLEDLDPAPLEPARGADHLPPNVQALLKEWKAGTPVWVAGAVEKWDAIALTLRLFKVPADDVDALVQLRTLGLSLEFYPGVVLNARIRCASEAAAKKLDAYLALRKPDDVESLRVLGPGRLTEPIARELGRTLARTCEGNTVTIRAEADEKVVAEALQGR